MIMEDLIFFLTHLIMSCCMIFVGWIAAGDSKRPELSRYRSLHSPLLKMKKLLNKWLYREMIKSRAAFLPKAGKTINNV